MGWDMSNFSLANYVIRQMDKRRKEDEKRRTIEENRRRDEERKTRESLERKIEALEREYSPYTRPNVTETTRTERSYDPKTGIEKTVVTTTVTRHDYNYGNRDVTVNKSTTINKTRANTAYEYDTSRIKKDFSKPNITDNKQNLTDAQITAKIMGERRRQNLHKEMKWNESPKKAKNEPTSTYTPWTSLNSKANAKPMTEQQKAAKAMGEKRRKKYQENLKW